MNDLIIFDLDGTLLDTIADLANASNYALRELDFPTHSVKDYHQMVGNGITNLLKLALPQDNRDDKTLQEICNLFVPYYNIHNADASAPYPGIVHLLEQLQHKGIQMAVASNKYQTATEKLVAHYFPTIHFIAVFGQREGIAPKPDAHIIEDILKIAKIDKSKVLYVGDSGIDMQTAKNGGVASCGVSWGFRPRMDLEQYHPEFIVDSVEELHNLLLKH